MNKSITTCLVAMTVGWSAHAQHGHQDQQIKTRVLNKSERIQRLLNQHIDDLSGKELMDIHQKLKGVLSIIKTGDDLPDRPGRGHGPGRRPGRGAGDLYQAVCHIDDDPNFDKDQNVVGTIKGETVSDLVEECQALAEASYGSRGSSGLVGLSLVGGQVPRGFQSATCHIDDDPNFDKDQVVVGKLAAATLEEMISDCNLLAEATYGSRGSSGLVNLNVDAQAPRSMKTADCWLDDDPSFDEGQTYGGIVWGQDVRDLIGACKSMASDYYGSRGSSGLKNVR